MFVAVLKTFRAARWRSLAAVHTSSGTMRRLGTSVMTHSDCGLRRETRRPVSGSLTYRSLFQIKRPTHNSLLRIPVPRAWFPWIVLGLHCAPNGQFSIPCGAALIV